jgi:hypothetical protein
MSVYVDPAKDNNDETSIASDASSPILRERRAKHLEQEKQLRVRMNRIEKRMMSPDSSAGMSTHSSSQSFDGSVESSLLSLNLSRSSGSKKDLMHLKWEKILVEFSFGLLTSAKDAPPKGSYHKISRRNPPPSDSSTISTLSSTYLLDRSSILRNIIKKVNEVSKASVQHRSGNVIIKSRTPYVVNVARDRSYKPPKNRPGVVRSYVKAIVPIEISDVRVMELTRSSQIISKIIIKQALIEGVKRKIFEPLTEKY